MLDTYQEINEWFAANGDNTHIFNHNLDENSIVMDLGAYTGVWALELNKYIQCKIFLFEPIEEFYKIIEKKFNNFNNINYLQVGIGVENKTLFISNNEIKQDATKILFKDENIDIANSNIIQLITLENIINKYNLNYIDLMQINIEGAEYDILENWLETGIINKIKILQIQFHNFAEIENHVNRRKNIQLELKKNGYKLKYCYQWVWEAWEK